jgi:hypothetical protein
LYVAAYTHGFALSNLQRGLNLLEGWCRRWWVKLNGDKSKLIFFSRLRESLNENYKLALFNDMISPETKAKLLGVEFDSKLCFETHIAEICGRENRRINVLRVLSRSGIKSNVLITLYKIYVHPLFEYGSIAFMAAP